MRKTTDPVAVPGFADAHTHLLRAAAGIPFPWQPAATPGIPSPGDAVAEFHRRVARAGSTPMDVPEPDPPAPAAEMAARLGSGLAAAAATGLVEITEMGMRAWWYLAALAALERSGALPVRVRIYLASGLTEDVSLAELDARRTDAGSWVSLDGVKFYADGWLGPRTCALGHPFHDGSADGLLFMPPGTLARRIGPLAQRGWRIATHAIGDRAVAAVLDAYELVWGGDLAAQAAAGPRIEHASVLSAELIARMAETGTVACLQPSFAVTDAEQVQKALGPERAGTAYPWAALAAAGARLLAGTDYPIEVLDPLAGLARLVSGRAERPGFHTDATAPEGSRLGAGEAFGLLTDAAAGETLLSADPRTLPPDALDQVAVLGTRPVPFGG
jgi:predicted amidohydrolase YtcJ